MRLLLALIVIWAEPLHVHGLGEAEAPCQQAMSSWPRNSARSMSRSSACMSACRERAMLAASFND